MKGHEDTKECIRERIRDAKEDEGADPRQGDGKQTTADICGDQARIYHAQHCKHTSQLSDQHTITIANVEHSFSSNI